MTLNTAQKIESGSAWDEVKIPHFSPLRKTNKADVAIVGGGLTGTTLAYFLGKSGKKVILLEKNRMGFGATGATTAMLTYNIDTSIEDLIKMYGEESTRQILESHQKAISSIESIIRETGGSCEFLRCSNYVYANSEKENETLVQMAKAAKKLGFDFLISKNGLPGFANAGYLEIKDQAKFHPLKYLRALVLLAHELPIRLFEKTAVLKIEGEGPYILKTERGDVVADQIAVTTYAPFDRKFFFKKAFYTSYVFEAEIEPGILTEGIYEDTLLPYHYFRVDKGKNTDRLIIGGEDHRSDIKISAEKNFGTLRNYVEKTFSNTHPKIVRKWKGPILETVDGLPYIGSAGKPNIFYATGFSGNGMTYSNIAAHIIADTILGRKPEFSDLYAATRSPSIKRLLYKGKDYTQALLGGAVKNVFTKTKA